MAPPDLNSLLRFLSQDAKLPLSTALSVAKPLQAASLSNPQQISSSNVAALTGIFPTTDDAKKVLNAAKRISKRPATDGITSSPRKKRKLSPPHEPDPEREAADLESSLTLPSPVLDADVLASTTFVTNRAPLMLAFTFALLEYTMPRQPLSSRLSLAQAVVSQGAREKAKHLGLEKDAGAQEEGWGTGQPTVKVMSRDIRVIRRVGYPLSHASKDDSTEVEHVNAVKLEDVSADDRDSEGLGTPAGRPIEAESSTGSLEQRAPKDDDAGQAPPDGAEVAFWALDLEALKKSNTNIASNTTKTSFGGLPIYSPHSARAYIMKAFASAPGASVPAAGTKIEDEGKSSRPKKPESEAVRKEKNLGLLLGALKLLFDSWKTLGTNELGRRAFSWYVAVRPDVEHGPAGWGGKGEVSLRKILDFRR